LQYPAIDDDTEFTLIEDDDNQPGKFNLTAGHCDYLLPLDGVTELTVIVRALPQFDYETGSSQYLWSWHIDASHHLYMRYVHTADRIYVVWQDGGNQRAMTSDVYANNGELQVWQDFAFTMNFTTGAGAFYIDRVEVDHTWAGGPADAKTSYFPRFSLRHQAGDEGDYHINYMRILTNHVATATEIANDLKTVQTEELFWSFDGHGLGRSRCNVTSFGTSFTLEKSRENAMSGSPGANSLTVDLQSTSGEFADDQYDTFDPPNVYNGSSAQKYLQKRCPVSMEHWYDHLFEPLFLGRVDDTLFTRFSGLEGVSTVTIGAEDMVSDIAREGKRKARYWEGRKLSDATEADSLVHLIARLATQRTVYNFAANSSFENADITNSWIVAGAGATFAKSAGDADDLFGSNQGDLDYAAAICTVTQTIMFTGTKKLNKGETWNFSIWVRTDANLADASTLIGLYEDDAVGNNDSSTQVVAMLTGKSCCRIL
jgi:hypothetical protein